MSKLSRTYLAALCAAVWLLVLAPTQSLAGQTWGESCSAARPCDSGLTCQPGVHKCYSSPRKHGEPCVAGHECGPGLSCHPGVHKCLSIPRAPGEACSAGYPCDADSQCASGEQICVQTSTRGEGAFCDGVTRKCGQGLYCYFKHSKPSFDEDISAFVPRAGTGKCMKNQDRWDSESRASFALKSPLPYYSGFTYSSQDSEADTYLPGDTENGLLNSICTENQVMVGVSATLDYFNRVETDRGRKFNWDAIVDLQAVCVDTDQFLQWKSRTYLGRKMDASKIDREIKVDFDRVPAPLPQETAGYVRTGTRSWGPGRANLVCPVGSRVKRITGSYGSALFRAWNDDDYLYSLNVVCTNGGTNDEGQTTETVGGFPASDPSSYSLSCPAQHTPIGFFFNQSSFAEGSKTDGVNLRLSHKSWNGDTIANNAAGTDGRFVITNGLTMFCRETSTVMDKGRQAEEVKPQVEKLRNQQIEAPKGGGPRYGTTQGERICNEYLDQRRIPDWSPVDGKTPLTPTVLPMQEISRLKLCTGASTPADAANRLACFFDKINKRIPTSKAAWECSGEAQPSPNQPTPQGGGDGAGLPYPPAPPPPRPQSQPAAPACDPAKEQTCRELVQGQVPWTTKATDNPAARQWLPNNLDNLCRCTKNPPDTVQCFQNQLCSNGNNWYEAIESCRAR